MTEYAAYYCVFFQRTVISQCLVGSHIRTKPVVKVYFDVCARHIEKAGLPTVFVYNSEQFIAVGIVLFVPEDSFPFQQITKEKA